MEKLESNLGYKKAAADLNNMNYQINLMRDFINLLTVGYNNRKDPETLATLHYMLFQENALGHIDGLLEEMGGTMDSIALLLMGGDEV